MPRRPRRQARTRLVYLLSALAVLALGLASRRFGASLPSLVAAYAGDTLWALLLFLVLGFVAPSLRLARRTWIALAFAFAVEASQLYHAPWIDALRHTRLGGLVLGFGFLWSDLVCYSVGVGLGALGECAVRRAARNGSPRREEESQ